MTAPTTNYDVMPAVSDAVHALLTVLTPVQQAALAGSIMANAGLDDDTIRAFADELTEEDCQFIGEQLA